MIIRWLVPAVLLVLAGAAYPQDVDLDGIRPASLVAENSGELERAAFTAYNDARYEDAARAYVRLLERRPGDSSALYNLACCFGLLGRATQAADFLEASWDAGFTDLAHILGDPDFEPVRASEEFAAALARLEERAEKDARRKGKAISVPMEMLGTVRVVEPAKIDDWRRYPLVIGLHGFGSNAEDFAGIFIGRGIDQDFIYCAVRAPYGFSLGSEIGWSWGYMERGSPLSADIRSGVLNEKYVLAVLERLKEEYRIDEQRVFLLGFSQGAGAAFTIGMRNPEIFRGVIPIGGWLDEGGFSPSQLERARKHGNFLVVHSPGDRRVEFEGCERAIGFLSTEGVPFSLLTYEGGHSIPAEVSRRVADWVADPRAGRRWGPEAATLRYGFRRGETAVYRTLTETEIRSGSGGVVSRVAQTDTALWRGTGEVDDGDFGIEISYRQVGVRSMGGASGEFNYDSTNPPQTGSELPLPGRAAASLVGRTLRLTVSPRGVVRGLEGYRAIYEDLIEAHPEAVSLAPNFSDALRTQAMQLALGRFPAEALRVGDQWTEVFPLSIPSMKEGEIRLEFTLAEVRVEDGRRLAVIEVAGGERAPEWGRRPAVEGQAALEVTAVVLEGEMLLDLLERKVRTSRRSLTLSLRVSGTEVETLTRTRTERQP